MKKLNQFPLPTRLLLVAIAVVILAGIGYAIRQKMAVTKLAELDAKYVSFDGDYLFSIPAKYTVNGTAIPKVTIVYPEGSPLQKGQSVDELYLNGTVAVQAIGELKSDNPEAFTAYVKDVLAADLRKMFNSPSDLRPAKQKDADANEIYALGPDGKRLRALFAINFTQPILVAAQDRSEAFKTVGFTMEDLKKSSFKPDIDQAAEVIKEIAQKLQQQKSGELRTNSTAKFRKKITEGQLVDNLKKSAQHLQRPISIVGGLYNDKFFIAQLVFESKTKDEQPTAGVVSLQKKGKVWQLDDLQLPRD